MCIESEVPQFFVTWAIGVLVLLPLCVVLLVGKR